MAATTDLITGYLAREAPLARWEAWRDAMRCEVVLRWRCHAARERRIGDQMIALAASQSDALSALVSQCLDEYRAHTAARTLPAGVWSEPVPFHVCMKCGDQIQKPTLHEGQTMHEFAEAQMLLWADLAIKTKGK